MFVCICVVVLIFDSVWGDYATSCLLQRMTKRPRCSFSNELNSTSRSVIKLSPMSAFAHHRRIQYNHRHHFWSTKTVCSLKYWRILADSLEDSHHNGFLNFKNKWLVVDAFSWKSERDSILPQTAGRLRCYMLWPVLSCLLTAVGKTDSQPVLVDIFQIVHNACSPQGLESIYGIAV